MRDADKEGEVAQACRRFGLDAFPIRDCCITVLHGGGLSDNRFLYVVCPPVVCRLWFVGLRRLVRIHGRHRALSDRRMLWLRDQYMQLYHEDGYCCGPLAADAIRAFGGRDWSLAGSGAVSGGTAGLGPCSNSSGGGGGGEKHNEPSGTLRREVSMKIKKKQLLSSQASKERLRGGFVEPATMCMESSYWRNPTHHRQSTPTAFLEHQPDVARHHSLGHLACAGAGVGAAGQPKLSLSLSLARDARHGSTEHLWHGRNPRVGSILYDTQLDFVDFVALFRSFSLLMRKDLRDLFEQLAISYRSVAVANPKVNGVKDKVTSDSTKKPTRLGELSDRVASLPTSLTRFSVSARRTVDQKLASGIGRDRRQSEQKDLRCDCRGEHLHELRGYRHEQLAGGHAVDVRQVPGDTTDGGVGRGRREGVDTGEDAEASGRFGSLFLLDKILLTTQFFAKSRSADSALSVRNIFVFLHKLHKFYFTYKKIRKFKFT